MDWPTSCTGIYNHHSCKKENNRFTKFTCCKVTVNEQNMHFNDLQQFLHINRTYILMINDQNMHINDLQQFLR